MYNGITMLSWLPWGGYV